MLGQCPDEASRVKGRLPIVTKVKGRLPIVTRVKGRLPIVTHHYDPFILHSKVKSLDIFTLFFTLLPIFELLMFSRINRFGQKVRQPKSQGEIEIWTCAK